VPGRDTGWLAPRGRQRAGPEAASGAAQTGDDGRAGNVFQGSRASTAT
jgi:hypothetical protein